MEPDIPCDDDEEEVDDKAISFIKNSQLKQPLTGAKSDLYSSTIQLVITPLVWSISAIG